MKALSPLIAAIMLIVITIAVGTIVSNFLVQFVSKQTRSQTICATNTFYTIESAVFNQSGDNLLILTITNKGEERLYGFGIEFSNATDIERIEHDSIRLTTSPQISDTNFLRKGQSAILKADMSGDSMVQTADVIKVTNLGCPDASAQTREIAR